MISFALMFEGHLVISKSPYINDGKNRGWKKSAQCSEPIHFF